VPSKKGQRKRRPLDWNDERITKALALVFIGRLSYEKIALDCTIPLRTLKDWIAHPEFQSKLREKREKILDTCDDLRKAYARKEQRIIALSELAESARCEYEEHIWMKERRQVGYDREEEAPIYIIKETYNRDAYDACRGALDDIAKELGHRKQVADVTTQVNVSYDAPQPNDPITAAQARALIQRVGMGSSPGDTSGTSVAIE
jgi:hypothetical protein